MVYLARVNEHLLNQSMKEPQKAQAPRKGASPRLEKRKPVLLILQDVANSRMKSKTSRSQAPNSSKYRPLQTFT